MLLLSDHFYVGNDFEALEADALATDALGDLIAHLFEPLLSRGIGRYLDKRNYRADRGKIERACARRKHRNRSRGPLRTGSEKR
jgi:hypothetical protein